MFEQSYKNCLFCKYFVFTCGSPDWSEYTPGSDAEIYCGKNVFEIDLFGDSQKTYMNKMLTAKNCEYFVDTRNV